MFIYYLLACLFCAAASLGHRWNQPGPAAFPYIHIGWLGMAGYFFGLCLEVHGKG